MSFKVSAKEVTRNYVTFKAGYCTAQHILKYASPTAHTAGTYGWNSDVYTHQGWAISTGYRPCGLDGYRDIIAKYDTLAEKAGNDRQAIDKLYLDMWRELAEAFRAKNKGV